ncbi:MAG: hypothetical protein ONB44_17930 [candidate division KSB1 bacterium]|nr:hypothetical protein [candidate division KSB1 bacterium]MDZ7304007.1 hypothetical protein [candidate division KSB1 bacterium]MDZ7313283.1 hypothetical protein [candidate division KSB1 bacterium]
MKKFLVILATVTSLVFAACSRKPTVDEVVNKMMQTLGGVEKIASMQDQVSTWESKVMMPQGDTTTTMTATMTITYKRPNKLKYEAKDSNGNIGYISVFDGSHGWIYMMGPDGVDTVRDMTPTEIQEATIAAETWADAWYHYAAKGFKLTMLPDTVMAGKTYHRIHATDRFGNVSLNYFDTQTCLVERTDTEVSDPVTMQKTPSVMTLSDYAVRDGYMVIGKYTQSDTRGAILTQATLQEVKHNTNITDEAFARPVTTVQRTKHTAKR